MPFTNIAYHQKYQEQLATGQTLGLHGSFLKVGSTAGTLSLIEKKCGGVDGQR